jgi:hypothetical protein
VLLQLHLIALSKPFSGDMRGVRGADFACYHEARAAGFTTTFRYTHHTCKLYSCRAFLSSQVQDLDKIVHYGDRESPVVNLHGQVLFDTWQSMFVSDSHMRSNVPLLAFDQTDVMHSSRWCVCVHTLM